MSHMNSVSVELDGKEVEIPLHVPGNESIHADHAAGKPREPSSKELARAIQWYREHQGAIEEFAKSGYSPTSTGLAGETPHVYGPAVDYFKSLYGDKQVGRNVDPASGAFGTRKHERVHERLERTWDPATMGDHIPEIRVPTGSGVDYDIAMKKYRLDAAKRAMQRQERVGETPYIADSLKGTKYEDRILKTGDRDVVNKRSDKVEDITGAITAGKGMRNKRKLGEEE